MGLLLLAGCASNNGNRPRDGGGSMDGGEPGDGGGDCERDEDCPDDGIFCNGGLACVEGRCVASEVPTCNDGIACTRDECIGATDECQNTPIDTACPPGNVCIVGSGCGTAPSCEFDSDCTGDGMFCNGDEVCVGGMCLSPAAGRDCADDNSCTADECVEATRDCANTPYPDFLTNTMHCGTGANDCVVCPEPDPSLHQVAVCTEGACGLACMPGFTDRNGDPADGCEYGCTIMPGLDAPDDAFTDANCDGIDGDRALAIFVSTSGSDANDGLTPATALASLRRAFEIFAAAPTRVQILVATGSYSSSTMLELPNGVGVYGGYSADFLTRTDTRASVVASTPTALRAGNLTLPTTIDRVSFTTADRTAASEAAIALIVDSSGANLTLRFLSVTAGRGGAGAMGSVGTVGSTGGVGAEMTNNRTSGGGGGAPGGGAGASGVFRGEGVRGNDGSRVGTGCGHGGPAPVSSGRGCADGDPAPPGPNGEPGCPGSRGAHGMAGDGLGTFSGSTWSPSSGATGGTGTPGGGGGGGASGSGEDCTYPWGDCWYCGTGRAGGGGGGGGGGGTGGGGGGGGGASVGIRLIGSTLNAQQLRVQTAGGGNGGNGSGGGPGGPGGAGRAGAISTENTAASGGAGGQGGVGGEGGCGGGGGGGPSIAIWGDGTSARLRELSPVMFITGAGGTAGGSCGNAGSPGTSTNVRDAFFD